MSMIKYFYRLQYIDFLIRRKATGTLQRFAQKNRLSKRNLAYVLKDMKEMGFPIKYDRIRGSYYYTKPGKMAEKLFMEENTMLEREDLKKNTFENIDNLCFSNTSVFKPCDF